MTTVNVWASEGDRRVIAMVNYQNNLDCWSGHSSTNGGIGRHKGITKLKDDRHVIIYGTEHPNEKDYALVVTPEKALQEILESGHTYLLKDPKFESLNLLYEQLEQEET